MKRCYAVLLFCVLVVLAMFALHAQTNAPMDGRDHPLQDALLDNLVGNWNVTRVMNKQTFETSAQAEWVLNHQFVRLHYHDSGPSSKYEAMVFIGYDNAGRHYVVHWIDVFGGHFSQTLGSGQREGNVLKITFNYPDGEFTNTLTFDPKDSTWSSLMRQKQKSGEWGTFGEEKFRRASKSESK
jgi:Protein of unknown function (DUF1579)